MARYYDEDGKPIKLRDIPDAFGRGKDGRIPRGQSMSAETAKNVIATERDPLTGKKTYRQVRGGRALTRAEMAANAANAKEHEKKLKEQKAAQKKAAADQKKAKQQPRSAVQENKRKGWF